MTKKRSKRGNVSRAARLKRVKQKKREMKNSISLDKSSTVPCLSSYDVAVMLGVSITTVQRLRASGKGPVWHRIGSQVRYSLADLYDYIERSKKGGS